MDEPHAPAEPPGHREVRELMLSDALSPMVRTLRKRYPDAAADAEDAVTDAVAKFLAKRTAGEEMEKPAGWIFVTAKRFLLNKLEREVNRETSDDALADGHSDPPDGEVLDKDTYQFLKGLVERWESRRLSVVTLLYLEAEYENEPLTQQEAAEQASVLLDEDVPWTSVGKTRSRGFVRLREQIRDIARQTGINPIDGRETK